MFDCWLVLDQHLTIIQVPPHLAEDPFYKSIIGLNIRDAEPPVGEELIRCYETALEVGCAACMTEYPAGRLVEVLARRSGDTLTVSYRAIDPAGLRRILESWNWSFPCGAESQAPPPRSVRDGRAARHLRVA